MTLSRSILVFCLCLSFTTWLSAQEEQLPADLRAQVMHARLQDAAASDSVGNQIQVPNVFSPNGDQINDHIDLETDGVTLYRFSVFTRTGTRVYQSLSPRIFWDGKSLEGIDLQSGIYYYVIEEETTSEPFTQAGFIYLFR